MPAQSAHIADRPDNSSSRNTSLWQRIISSWLRTYELACVDGGMPFVLL